MKNKTDFEFIVQFVMDNCENIKLEKFSNLSYEYELTVITKETHFHVQGESVREVFGKAEKALKNRSEKSKKES